MLVNNKDYDLCWEIPFIYFFNIVTIKYSPCLLLTQCGIDCPEIVSLSSSLPLRLNKGIARTKLF